MMRDGPPSRATFATDVPQVGLPEQSLDDAVPPGAVVESLEDGEVVEEAFSRNAGVDAELLR
jgi:hypothetical protein